MSLSVAVIVDCVAMAYGASVNDILSHRKPINIVRPRQIAMLLARRLTGLSYVEIGQRFGDRDHTTILHGCQRMEEAEKTDTGLARDLAMLAHIMRTTEAGILKAGVTLVGDIDPVAIALQIVDAPTRATNLSVDQALALSRALLNAREERQEVIVEAGQLQELAERQRAEIVALKATIVGLRQAPPSSDGVLRQAVDRVVSTRAAMVASAYTRAEKPTREAFERAVRDLETITQERTDAAA